MERYCRNKGIACEFVTEYGYCQLTGCAKRNQAAQVQYEVRKAVAEVAEADICRTCYICRKAFPVDNVWAKDPICPGCLDKIRKVLGVTV